MIVIFLLAHVIEIIASYVKVKPHVPKRERRGRNSIGSNHAFDRVRLSTTPLKVHVDATKARLCRVTHALLHFNSPVSAKSSQFQKHKKKYCDISYNILPNDQSCASIYIPWSEHAEDQEVAASHTPHPCHATHTAHLPTKPERLKSSMWLPGALALK